MYNKVQCFVLISSKLHKPRLALISKLLEKDCMIKMVLQKGHAVSCFINVRDLQVDCRIRLILLNCLVVSLSNLFCSKY